MASFIFDSGLSALQAAKGFSPGTNFAVEARYDTGTPGTIEFPGYRRPCIDEFIDILPFESHETDPLRGVFDARPKSDDDALGSVAMLPGPPTPPSVATLLGADWYALVGGATPPLLELTLQRTDDSPNFEAARELFSFKRLGTQFDIDRFQAQLAAMGGPDPTPTLIRAASLALVRQLSRDALNNVDQTAVTVGGESAIPRLPGLAFIYGGMFRGYADRQVVQATTPTATYTLVDDVDLLLRRVTPSHGGFGASVTVLLMTARARTALMKAERAAGAAPAFLPSTGGSLRYHFQGVPVYIAPIRQDEVNGAGSTPKYPENLAPPAPFVRDFTSIYAMRLGGASGLRMCHFGGQSAQYGVQVDQVAPNNNDASVGYKVHGVYGWRIPEHEAVARLWDVGIGTIVE